MKVTVLGTGTSQGVPVIACSCAACISDDHRDRRLRCSILVASDKTQIVIDVGPDFRQQMLANRVERLDAALITHEHNDHIIGLDDMRPYIFKLQAEMPIYALSRVNSELRRRFYYAFTEQPYPGAPRFSLVDIEPEQAIRVGDIDVMPLAVSHGRLDILGYKIGRLAYITDASHLSERTMAQLSGVDILIINALRRKPHHAHFTLAQALAVTKELNVKQVYITHISHALGRYEDWKHELPENVSCAYDGLVIKF